MRDVIVIGAGAGGPVVAKELAARGLDVLVLEAGHDSADVERDWTHLETDMNHPLAGWFRWGPSDRSKPAWFRELPQNSFVTQVAGVGGTTQHYFGNAPRGMPGAFAGYAGADASAYDRAHEFPFPYADLVPYYEWVEATLPVQTAAMGTKERLFFDGAEAAGLPVLASKDITRDSFRPQENAILQPGGTAGRATSPALLRFPQAQGCTFCGYCFQGCYEPIAAPRNLKAKRSTAVSYVPMALTADKWSSGGQAATLVTDAFVTRVHTTTSGGELVARAVSWRDTRTGATFTEDARVVVLAAGCVENPRLWFNSGLPNPNGWVGRGLTDHSFDWVVGVFDRDTGSSKGASSAARADFPGRGCIENVGLPPGLQAFSMNLSDAGIPPFYDRGQVPVATDVDRGRVLGTELMSVLADVNRVLNVLVLTDDDVEPANRVTLSAFPADEHGAVPTVAMEKRNRSARTRANRERLVVRTVEILRSAGAARVLHVDWAPLLLHMQSSMRMGASPADSVLDANAEARAVRRLFVADTSALANSLGGPNPSLTAQALATRTAEYVFRSYFGGDPWIAAEAPVPSSDPAVTDALG